MAKGCVISLFMAVFYLLGAGCGEAEAEASRFMPGVADEKSSMYIGGVGGISGVESNGSPFSAVGGGVGSSVNGGSFTGSAGYAGTSPSGPFAEFGSSSGRFTKVGNIPSIFPGGDGGSIGDVPTGGN